MIEPALTAEEWAEMLRRPSRVANGIEESAQTGDFHGAAALALYGQPFGFTREDMEMLEQIQDFVYVASVTRPELRAWAKGMADRIEALLPPETT